MGIKAVLFDLDGTLLPMDYDLFVKTYFGLLAKKLAPRGYEPKKLIDAIWAGTAAMVKNDGEKSNEDVFWQDFEKHFGAKAKQDMPLFDDFYRNEFDGAKSVCGYEPLAAETIKMLKESGLRVALATNPIFPAIATEKRIRWAGLEPSDFELYTTYENSRYSKPNPKYYTEIAEKLRVEPTECLMAGNDVDEDMVAQKVGMRVFLLTDCLINKSGKDIDKFPHGRFTELTNFIKQVIK